MGFSQYLNYHIFSGTAVEYQPMNKIDNHEQGDFKKRI
jgi:hypothetical protein